MTLAEGVSFTPQTGISAFAVAGSTLVHAPSVGALGGQLTWYDRQGRAAETVGTATDVRGFDVLPQGILAHAHDEVTGGDIWRYALSGDSATRLTFPPAHNVAPKWSPDGSAFAFSRGEKRDDDRMSVYFRRVEAGGGEERVFGPVVQPIVTSWSRDGKYLFLQVNSGASTEYDIWLVALGGDHAAKPLLATPDSEGGAQLSPDGKWLAYMAQGRGEMRNVYLQAFPEAAGRIQISTEGGSFPVWSHSGRELFFVTRDGALAVVTIDAAGGSVAPSTPKVLFRAVPGAVGEAAPYAVSPNDQRFLMPSSSRTARPLIVTTGWQSLVTATR